MPSGSATHAYIDERLVYSMLSNLLSNAIKYSPRKSEIYFVLICEPHQVQFQVSDQGMGITLAEREFLYEPFWRGSNAITVTGTGLGLVVVKKCVELHHGDIEVYSQPGMGSKFTVTFPQGSKITA